MDARTNTALLIVDMQNDYFPQGAMELAGILDAAANAARLLQYFRDRGVPLFHIRHIATRPEAGFFLPGTDGAEIHPSLAPATGEKVITKNRPNSFVNTTLLDELRQLDSKRLVICGAMSHMCIDATVRAAKDYGFDCVVAHDACAARDLDFLGTRVPAAEVHAAYMAALAWAYAEVAATDDLV